MNIQEIYENRDLLLKIRQEEHENNPLYEQTYSADITLIEIYEPIFSKSKETLCEAIYEGTLITFNEAKEIILNEFNRIIRDDYVEKSKDIIKMFWRIMYDDQKTELSKLIIAETLPILEAYLEIAQDYINMEYEQNSTKFKGQNITFKACVELSIKTLKDVRDGLDKKDKKEEIELFGEIFWGLWW